MFYLLSKHELSAIGLKTKETQMKQKRFIKLTQDLMFKSFFSKDEKVLISLLKSFLPALQDKRIENIQILNPENEGLISGSPYHKESYLKKAGQTSSLAKKSALKNIKSAYISNNPADKHTKENKDKQINNYEKSSKYKESEYTENNKHEKTKGFEGSGQLQKIQAIKDKIREEEIKDQLTEERAKDKITEERVKDKTREQRKNDPFIEENRRDKTKPELVSLDSSVYPRSFSKKQITLDLRLKLNTGENINVEMQSLSQKAFLERILFYWAKLYTDDLKRGEGYEKLYPAYSLVFTDFDVLPARLTDYVNSFSIRLDKQPYEELTNHLKIVIVELSKFKYKSLQNLDKKGSWCYVLKKSENLHEKELEILSKKGLGGAMALLKNVSESDRLRYEQESRDKFLFDQRWDRIYNFEEGMQKGLEKGLQKGRQEGREEGMEEGLQKGRQEEKEEVVLSMLENGFDLDSISKVTKLSKEEIKKIQNKEL